MSDKLDEYYQQKKQLEERIRISEISNDSYYLSPLYKTHKRNLAELDLIIEKIQKEEKLFNR